MDFQEFLIKIQSLGYGIVAFNTYYQRDVYYCYIMISEKGDTGKFYKREFKTFELNDNLQFIYNTLDYIIKEEEYKDY